MESYELMKPVFKQIAAEENGYYQFRDENNWSDGPITYHKLIVPIQDAHIEIDYDLGNHNLAIFSCKSSSFDLIPALTISRRSPYLRLFNKKLKALKVNCDDDVFKNLLQNKLIELGLESIARDSQFDPDIRLIQAGEFSELKTRFCVGFKYKHCVIQPLLRFYEAVIGWGSNK